MISRQFMKPGKTCRPDQSQIEGTFSKDEVDANLENKLSLELSGIFNWAIEGYNRLRENDFKLPNVSSMTTAKEEYRRGRDILYCSCQEGKRRNYYSL